MQRVSESVLCLGSKHFNMFVVGKRRGAVVECGVTGAVVKFQKQWEQWVPKPRIDYLVAMHAHFDHVCGIPGLKALFPEAEIAASPEAA